VWGNVVTAAFATEEGAFLRGQIRMEEQVEVHRAAAAAEEDSEAANSAEETGEEAGSQAA
jgi:predicted HAD superfamily Cof-like phosphohydrolase